MTGRGERISDDKNKVLEFSMLNVVCIVLIVVLLVFLLSNALCVMCDCDLLFVNILNLFILEVCPCFSTRFYDDSL